MRPHARLYSDEVQLVRSLFLRSFGAVSLVAFTSMRRQILGLVGSKGIAPVGERLATLEGQLGPRRFMHVPTALWFDASDAALIRVCRTGQAASTLLVMNVAPRWSCATIWGSYLSLVSAGSEFFAYQWDSLLLESAAHAALLSPPGLLPRRSRSVPPPARLAVLAVRALLFRLYLSSGASKLTSGDLTWRDLTACKHYFETQPLPTRLGWRAHALPNPALKAATAATLFIELAVPWLFFAPRKLRGLALGGVTLLQALIAATGNYGFFNLLTGALHLWLLDDEMLRGSRPSKVARHRGARLSRVRSLFENGAALGLGALMLDVVVARSRFAHKVPRVISRALYRLRSLRLASPYGLFSVMTVKRPEIALEASNDGAFWTEYRFRYKPDATDCAPKRAALHMPRLDWQLWFAALGSPPAWFMSMLVRLLEASPQVLSLFEADPMGGKPPRYVRALLYDYEMTDAPTRASTKQWWRRTRVGVFFPPVTLSPPQDEWVQVGWPWQPTARA
nr:membrane protein [uncultured bacterium]